MPALNGLSPKQVALAIGTSEASLKRWCDKGLIRFHKTAGGHRRIQPEEVMRYLRDTATDLARPDILGLPTATGKTQPSIDKARTLMRESLECGDEEQCIRLAFNLYLGQHTARDICDKVLSPAFYDIGMRWEHGQAEIYQERRGVEITKRIIYKLREFLPKPVDDAPKAIGATLETDPYSLAGLMIELALLEEGWNASFYGTGHPVSTLKAAINDSQPNLFWTSVSYFEDEEEFIHDFNELQIHAQESNVPLVVGGMALNNDIRQRINYSGFCDNLQHLITFVKTISKTA